MDSIEKLKEKVLKDPASKLFVPLAEEYKKAGMLDKAIGVLKEGLAKQPAYMSARVSLGKIYLESNLMSEAKEEFERVIKAIPDNLFARRKLADIYRALGEKDKALEQYKTVLKLNPFDEEALIIQQELEGGKTAPEPMPGAVSEETPPEEILPEEVMAEETLPEEFPMDGFISADIAPEEAVAVDAVEDAYEVKAEDFPEVAFAEDIGEDALQFGTVGAGFEQEAEASVGIVSEDEHVLEISEEEVLAEDIEALIDGSPEAVEGLTGGFVLPEEEVEEVFEVEAIEELTEDVSVEAVEDLAVEVLEETIPAEEAVSITEEVAEALPVVEENIEEAVLAGAGLREESEAEEISGIFEEAVEEGPEDLSMADLYITQGKYFDAMSVYRAALHKRPEDRGMMQRAMELKSLIKLLGKEKELIESNLQAFLEGIKRRRNEFFRNT